MVNLNRTLSKNWFSGFISVAVAALSFGIASTAFGQFDEYAPAADAWYQFSDHSTSVAQCGYDCPSAIARCWGANCNLGNYAAGVRHSAAMLRHRELPPGNMGLHFPYQANQMYYYRRPYNSFHVPTHVGESRNSSAQSTFGQSLGYSNQIFERIHQSSEQYHDAVHGGETEKDGLLEFVDWKKHQQSRLNWEANPRHYSGNYSGQRDRAYPYSNEEVMHRRSNFIPATALRQNRAPQRR